MLLFTRVQRYGTAPYGTFPFPLINRALFSSVETVAVKHGTIILRFSCFINVANYTFFGIRNMSMRKMRLKLGRN